MFLITSELNELLLGTFSCPSPLQPHPSPNQLQMCETLSNTKRLIAVFVGCVSLYVTFFALTRHKKSKMH